MRLRIILALLPFLLFVNANVEKIIFVAPELEQEPQVYPDVPCLSPSTLSLRRQIHATFPSASSSWRPSDTWVLLEGLQERQLYEVRICWSATVSRKSKPGTVMNLYILQTHGSVPTSFGRGLHFVQQPTAFDLSIHEPKDITLKQVLNESLWSYFDNSHWIIPKSRDLPIAPQPIRDRSTPRQFRGLLLQITATADYYSTNSTLMRDGLAVDLDISKSETLHEDRRLN